MVPLLVAIGAVAVLVSVIAAWRSRKRGEALGRLRERWDTPRAEFHDTDLDKVALYHRRLVEAGSRGCLDDQTWGDLALDEVFLRVDHARCGIGQQYVYQRLRCPESDLEPLDRIERLVQALDGDEAVRERLQLDIDRLDRAEVYYAPNLFLQDLPALPRAYRAAPALTLGAVALIAGSFVLPKLLIGAVAVVMVNLILRERAQRLIQPYVLPLRVVGLLVSTADRLARQLGSVSPDLARELKASAEAVSPLRRYAGALQLEGRGDDLVSFFAEYLNMVLLVQVNAFLLCSRFLQERRGDVQRLYDAVGRLDAALSVVAYRRGLPHHCIPRFVPADGGLDCVGIVHPLLVEPVPNTLQVKSGGVLVTGSNMAGKTTFMRAVALNAVLAQSLNTCTAEAYRAPFLNVRTLIDRRDDLREGQSYFFAEVLGIKVLLDQAARPQPSLFVVDEPFKGTNAVERLAASKAVLDYLTRSPHIVLATTHDHNLADLLEGHWGFGHFREGLQGDEVTFDYQIQPGRSSARNALRLLRAAGLPESVVSDALRTSEAAAAMS